VLHDPTAWQKRSLLQLWGADFHAVADAYDDSIFGGCEARGPAGVVFGGADCVGSAVEVDDEEEVFAVCGPSAGFG
jgi:hypothetical protein